MERTMWICAALSIGACGSDSPVDMAGDYSVNTTNRDNGCQLPNWTVGATSTGVMVTITQTGADAQAIIQGAGGVYVDTVIGGRTFTGTVSGAHLDATLHGTRPYTDRGCTYTFTAELDGSLAKDTLSGSITYIPATNHSPDCGVLESCMNFVEFNGLRPPT